MATEGDRFVVRSRKGDIDALKYHDLPLPATHDIAWRRGWGWVCWDCKVFLEETRHGRR